MARGAQDTLIRGARVIDGTGAPWFRADVRLAGGRIAAVGPGLPAAGASIVEASGRYLAPGFIDAHCHDDAAFLREPTRPEKVLQGVTTIVVGNCSFSLYPSRPASAEALRRHFSGLLGETAPDEVFDGLPAYRAALHGRGIGPNLVSLVGHAALRLAAVGVDDRPARPDEVAAMSDMLDAELAAGAAGLSLGLVYPPSAYADHREMAALAAVVARRGRVLAAHVRSYEAGLIDAVDEFLGLLRGSGAAGLLSHLQSAGRPNWGGVPRALARLEAARAEGIEVSFDMYPYPAGSSYMLQLLPPEAQNGGLDALSARLADPVGRAALRAWVERGPAEPGGAQSKIALIGWNNVLISGVGAPALKRFEGMRMDAAAVEAGLDPFDLMARFVNEDAGQTAIVMFQLGEADLRAACTHCLHMFGSDGLPRPGTRPHPRAYGTFPRVIGRLARADGWFSLEDGVRRMTSVAAQRFGLNDRGLLRPGLAADLVLFSEDAEDRATFADPVRLPHGITDVWVAGEPVVAGSAVTGRLPGRVLEA